MRDSNEHAIETMFLEERRYPPPAEFAAQANAQPEIYDQDFEEFWETEGRERVTWFEPFTKLYEWELPYAKWFLGGKLNVSYNCVDRHVEAGQGDKVAFYWEGEPEGDRLEITLRRSPAVGRPVRERAEGLGVRRARRSGSTWGWSPRRRSRCSPARGSGAAHGRVRRLLGGLARRAGCRHGVRGADHPGRGVAARRHGAAEGDRRRGDGRRPEGEDAASFCGAPATTCR